MSRGQLLAVGRSEYIKRKFGEGYNVKLAVPSPQQFEEMLERDKVNLSVPPSSSASVYDSSAIEEEEQKFANLTNLKRSPWKLFLYANAKKCIKECQLSNQQSSNAINIFVPFSAKPKLCTFFKEIEQYPGILVSMEKNTLEDTFISIGQEEGRKYLIQLTNREISHLEGGRTIKD
jgi:ATP-binding cassette subfamily A (ABC1) protein 3